MLRSLQRPSCPAAAAAACIRLRLPPSACWAAAAAAPWGVVSGNTARGFCCSSRPAALEADAKAAALAELAGSGWQVTPGRDAIQKTYQFDDFIGAFGWMTQVGLVAEKMDHHPEWCNVYGTVDVTLSTHDAGPSGALSSLDVALAQKMDSLC